MRGLAPIAVLLALAFPASASAVTDGKWTKLKTSGPTPPARSDSGLASTNSRTVFLFGGERDGTALGDLWRLDVKGKRWTKLAPSGPKPPARFGHTFVDAGDGTLLLFGGQSGGDFFDDVWRYVPATNAWSRIEASGPAARYGEGGSYDRATRTLWITHGFTNEGRFDDTWALADGAWSEASPAAPAVRPLERCLVGSAFHKGGVFLFGGQSDVRPFLADLWRFDTATRTWTELKPSRTPAARNLYGSARLGSDWVIFGGNSSRGALSDVWSLDLDSPAAFTRVRVRRTKPAARFGGELAPLGSRRAVLFGGATLDGDLRDTWVLSVSG